MSSNCISNFNCNNRVSITFIGQAGFVITSKSGQTLAIDVYLSDCVERLEGHIGFKRLLPKLFNASDIKFDYVIATHPHWDHFDYDSMCDLMNNGKTTLLASVECKKLVDEVGVDKERVSYVKPGEHIVCGDFDVHFVKCDHGEDAPDAVGVIVKVDGVTIYEAGDTCLRLDRVDEYLQHGPIDVLIAPINGAFGNMDEHDCAVFANALNAKLTIPCHYGMFATHGGNPGKFIEIMNNEFPDNKYYLMTQGETLELNGVDYE